ncbi:HNH endonuclease [Acinetobacter baumannii]|nr:HNH endonuclease [Acinetobacter baumannii]MDC5367244.1 HNH endonuclease [Acinetobacter baumannii]MDC5617665.1 HNH endonuclease [Acinetobacter baumannii]MDC5631671.1 HNH endonuclease [Acinetobacter baumannii]
MSLDSTERYERIYCDICHTREIFYPIYRLSSRICLCVECAREVANLYVYDFECRWIDHDYAAKYGETTKPKSRKTLPKKIRQSVFERDNFTCLYCESTSDLTIDHIVPVSCGGGDEVENLQTLCRVCNARKGTNLEMERTKA